MYGIMCVCKRNYTILLYHLNMLRHMHTVYVFHICYMKKQPLGCWLARLETYQSNHRSERHVLHRKRKSLEINVGTRIRIMLLATFEV